MPTKLKVPITITITHVENAVTAAMCSAITLRYIGDSIHDNYCKVADQCGVGEAHDQLEAQLKAQGIDWNTWLPPQPFLIAGHEPEFRADGSVKIGCQEIGADQIQEFLKRRAEAVKAVEPTWPRYFRDPSDNSIFKLTSAEIGRRIFKDGEHGNLDWSLAEMDELGATRITRAEAAGIVGEKNLNPE